MPTFVEQTRAQLEARAAELAPAVEEQRRILAAIAALDAPTKLRRQIRRRAKGQVG